MEALAAITAALTVVEKLMPLVEQAAKKGDITPEQQKAVRDKYNLLKDQADRMFEGPEWQVEN